MLPPRAVKYFCLMMVILLISAQPAKQAAFAAIEAVEFETPALLKRYQSLIAELRCLVCQNQNLADSDADLAKDLRRKTEEMLKAGQSDKEILAYMRERYGDFVLYRPPLNGTTSLLWIGPFVLLFIAATSVFMMIKRKQKLVSAQSNDDSHKNLKKVRDLLSRDFQE